MPPTPRWWPTDTGRIASGPLAGSGSPAPEWSEHMNQLEEAVYRAAEYGGGPAVTVQVPDKARVRFPDGTNLPVSGHADALAALPDVLADTVTTWWAD